MLQGSRVESSDLEDFFWYALSCSLVHHPRVCPTLLLWHRIIRLLWCVYPTWLIRIIRPHWVLQNSSNSAFLWVLSLCFALLGLFTSFLGPDEIHLTNTLVPLIALSHDHQNHSKWPKWGHVHYNLPVFGDWWQHNQSKHKFTKIDKLIHLHLLGYLPTSNVNLDSP